jgi:hypothetical protein
VFTPRLLRGRKRERELKYVLFSRMRYHGLGLFSPDVQIWSIPGHIQHVRSIGIFVIGEDTNSILLKQRSGFWIPMLLEVNPLIGNEGSDGLPKRRRP